ncbi:MAG: hypothetical protein ACKOS8_01590 [Gemmataceae bacterium]
MALGQADDLGHRPDFFGLGGQFPEAGDQFGFGDFADVGLVEVGLGFEGLGEIAQGGVPVLQCVEDAGLLEGLVGLVAGGLEVFLVIGFLFV